MNKILIAILILVLSSCDEKKDLKSDKNAYFNDFESSFGWIDNPNQITNDKASSGTYSTYVSSKNEYSLTFKTSMESLKLTNPKKVTAGFKTFIQDLEGLENLFVFAVSGKRDSIEKKSILWLGTPLKSKNPSIGAWTNIEFQFNLSEKFKPSDVIYCYLWGPKAKLSSYFDDFYLKFE